MPLTRWSHYRSRQSGASLIEVLVAVLILSFGMLALGGMMSYAVQMPKLAGYRASATSIGAGLVDRMRANTAGFAASAYLMSTTTYNVATLPASPSCVYPNCSPADIAALDKNETIQALRKELPGGNTAGITLSCGAGGCASLEGTLYVIWDEPGIIFNTGLNNSDSDENCGVTPSSGTPPRCVVVRFKL